MADRKRKWTNLCWMQMHTNNALFRRRCSSTHKDLNCSFFCGTVLGCWVSYKAVPCNLLLLTDELIHKQCRCFFTIKQSRKSVTPWTLNTEMFHDENLPCAGKLATKIYTKNKPIACSFSAYRRILISTHFRSHHWLTNAHRIILSFRLLLWLVNLVNMP